MDHIDSLTWIKMKKTTINPINNDDDKCFQYVATLTSNHKEIGKTWGRIPKIKLFTDKYNWKHINDLSGKYNC